MTDKMREEFEAWFTSKRGYGMLSKLFGGYEWIATSEAWEVWQAATKAERERCANLIEKMTAHRRMVRAAINGVKPEGCEYATAIRLGGDA